MLKLLDRGTKVIKLNVVKSIRLCRFAKKIATVTVTVLLHWTRMNLQQIFIFSQETCIALDVSRPLHVELNIVVLKMFYTFLII